MDRYTYKFSANGFDYFRDNATDRIIKLQETLKTRTDANIEKHAIDAEKDDAVCEFFS